MLTAQDKMALVKGASFSLANATSAKRTLALENVAKLLLERTDEIIAANQLDLDRGAKADMTKSTMDRIRLDAKRISAISDSVLKVSALPDVLGNVIRGMTLPNALQISQVRVPLGVIGVIYEARPNVTIDIAVLAIKSGNAVVVDSSLFLDDESVVQRSGDRDIGTDLPVEPLLYSADQLP